MADLDPAEFGLTATAAGAPGAAPAPPSFPMVAPHPAPDGSGAMTNLSDADYGKFMRGESPPPAVASAKPEALKADDFGLAPVQAQPSSAPPPQPSALSDLPRIFAGSLAATLAAIPRGVVGGKTDDYLNAAGMTPLNMLLEGEGPSAAFDKSLQDVEGQHQALATQYPVANTGGELTGALSGGLAMTPLLGWERGASFLPGAASYLARNAGVGGLMSALNGGDVTTGAAIGSIFPMLRMAGGAVSAPVRAAYQRLAPLWSNVARETSVGNVLGDVMNGSPVQTSPVGPLDLGQATNNPEVAARVDLAPNFNAGASAGVRNAQQQAVTDQIAKIGAPASAADASAGGVNAVRNLSGLTRERERELWNNPALTDYLFPTSGLKQAAQASLNGVANDDPGLMLGMTSDIRGALDGLMKTPDRANLQNINSYIGVLKSVARRPPPDNARAGALASRLLGSVGNALDATVTSSGAPSAVQTAYQAARDFTRERATILGTQDMRAMMAKNPTGAYVIDPSEGLRRFFNFSNGSLEGAQNLQQLIEFADKVKADWLGRGQAQLIGDARDALRDSARSYVAASLTKAARAAEGQNFNPKLTQDFLRTNGGWMRDSGLFSSAQINAADDLLDYAGMLRRPEQLLRQVNSATAARLDRRATFIDQIMTPWARRIVEIGGTVMGGHHGGVMGAGAGVAGSAAFEHMVGNAESAMREMMAEALLNPRVAQDLMMKASAANRAMMSPETRELLGRLAVAFGSDVLPHYSAPPPDRAPAPAMAH